MLHSNWYKKIFLRAAQNRRLCLSIHLLGGTTTISIEQWCSLRGDSTNINKHHNHTSALQVSAVTIFLTSFFATVVLMRFFYKNHPRPCDVTWNTKTSTISHLIYRHLDVHPLPRLPGSCGVHMQCLIRLHCSVFIVGTKALSRVCQQLLARQKIITLPAWHHKLGNRPAQECWTNPGQVHCSLFHVACKQQSAVIIVATKIR
jgi:hypothetical protein